MVPAQEIRQPERQQVFTRHLEGRGLAIEENTGLGKC